MKTFNVIASGSTGNAVIYLDIIMVDCGVPFKMVKPYLDKLQIILLTHEHEDHINIATLKSIQFERPSIRIGCCEWMVKHLKGVRNVDVYDFNGAYHYGPFTILPFKLYHDVTNCGYRLLFDNPDYSIFHATDTAHLSGISAIGYDLYAIEHNYDEETVEEEIAQQIKDLGFSYKKGAVNTHLSEQQARDFIYNNKVGKYEILRLHESKI